MWSISWLPSHSHVYRNYRGYAKPLFVLGRLMTTDKVIFSFSSPGNQPVDRFYIAVKEKVSIQLKVIFRRFETSTEKYTDT